ncbi:Translation machinery-associated protein 22 [Colletotrichum siamense]|uniref:Translation machinery-associated protein 22 n=1 Tax=Colletotrichum siamense TaxID=690259 RepID=A0A9P5EEU2_COLSI|nr:Translation machinery-associated protein 22 [Colletotrichum siamense]KAF4847577.1 Translation machinery-associated protein 22 [Colletotrichum siamense]
MHAPPSINPAVGRPWKRLERHASTSVLDPVLHFASTFFLYTSVSCSASALSCVMADNDKSETSGEPQGRHVIYCGVCTLPPEYCEYGGTVKKCQEWLQKNQPELYQRIWSAEALEAATASLSVDAQKRAAKDAQKKTAKAEAAEAKQADKLAKSTVTIKRIERNKRKFVTSVSGLEHFGLENKKVAKEFGKKFATGSSVTKTPSGGEEIVVQGDVSDEIEEFLLEKYKDIPEDNIELVEDKKKKSSS